MQTLCRVAPVLALLVLTQNALGQVRDEGSDAAARERRRALPGEDWSGSIGIGTNFPLDVGARFLARSPKGLRGSFSMGYLPQAYVGAINDVVIGFGGYDRPTAEVIQAALQSSIVLRSHFGWSPFKEWGPYAEVGYGFLSLGGSATTGEVLAQLVNQPLPPAAATAMPATFAVDAVLHQLDLEMAGISR